MRATTNAAWIVLVYSFLLKTISADLFHCQNPKNVDKKVSIECDKNTFEWNVNDLKPENPPEICPEDYILNQTDTLPDVDLPDDEEVCVLWSVFYGSLATPSPTTLAPTMSPTTLAPTMSPTTLAPTMSPTTLAPTMSPTTLAPTMSPTTLAPTMSPTLAPTMSPTLAPTKFIIADLFHCQDALAANENKDSIGCDAETHEWITDDLNPKKPPGICGNNYEEDQPDTVPEGDLSDDLEQCVWWSIFYGSLNTQSPSSAPTVRVTAAPTTQSPTRSPTFSPTPLDRTKLFINPFGLTLAWEESTTSILSLNRMELHQMTKTHILEYLKAEQMPVQSVTLDMSTPLTNFEDGSISWTETVSGTVQFEDIAPIPSSRLQQIVMDSFQNEGLELYQIRLSLAKDESLKLVSTVTIDSNRPDTDTEDNTTTSKWTPTLITIIVCVVCGVLVAFIFAYYLLFGRSKRRQRQEEGRAKRAMFDSSANLPPIPTDPTPPDDDYADEYDSDNDLPSQSSVSKLTYDDLENQSVATSTYSYREDSSLAPRSSWLQGNKNQQILNESALTSQNVFYPKILTNSGGMKNFVPYEFETESNAKDDMSLLQNDDESSLVRFHGYESQSVASDGRVGQISGNSVDSKSLQQQEGGFEDLWNDTDDNNDTDDAAEALNVSYASSIKPYDEAMAVTPKANSGSAETKPTVKKSNVGVFDETSKEETVNDYMNEYTDEEEDENQYSYDVVVDDNDAYSSKSSVCGSSLASDSYGFVYQRHYHAKEGPLMRIATLPRDDDEVHFQRTVVDHIPMSTDLNESVEVQSVDASSSNSMKASMPTSMLLESVKPSSPKVVAGTSARKKKSESWIARPSSPSEFSEMSKRSIESSDSAKLRALLNQPDIYDQIPGKEDDESVSCYLEEVDEDENGMPKDLDVEPASVKFEEKKEDGSNSLGNNATIVDSEGINDSS